MDAAELLVNYGVAGIVLGLFLWWAKHEHDRVVAERDRAIARSDDLVDTIHTDLSEAITAATRAIRAREEFENGIHETLTDVRRLLEGRWP